jgi:hypothetical protein
MIEIIFVVMLSLIIVQGFICAANLCQQQHHPLVRLLVIVPVLTALFTLFCMVDGSYQAFPADILRALATNAVYVLLTGHLVGKSWLGGQ